MNNSKQAFNLLNETYDLKDLNIEEQKGIQKLRAKINKHIGMMSLRSKKINFIESKVRKLIRY